MRQRAYEVSCKKLFDALDEMKSVLSKSRYLFGNRMVEADGVSFCTLIRFDVVLHGHSNAICDASSIIRIPSYLPISISTRESPKTVSIDQIKRTTTRPRGNYPTRIVPSADYRSNKAARPEALKLVCPRRSDRSICHTKVRRIPHATQPKQYLTTLNIPSAMCLKLKG